MTTQRQIESNRLNAKNHATGPKTLEGKEASRRNALKHGLAGKGIVLPEQEAEAIANRTLLWTEQLKPDGPYKVWLTEQAALESVRIDRCQWQQIALRTRLALRAAHCWDADRRLAAEELAARISGKPALVSRRLRESAQGCDLLLERWRGLVGVIDVNDDLDEKQGALALDLLGIPRELRTDLTLLSLAGEAPEVDPIQAIRQLAMAEIGALEALRSGVLDDLDGAEQGVSEVGLGIDDDAKLKRLQRYEADCKRRLHWALRQLAAPAEPSAAIAEPIAPVIEPVASAPPPPQPESPPEPLPAPASPPAAAPAPIVHKARWQGTSLVEALTAGPETGNRRERRARRKLAKKG